MERIVEGRNSVQGLGDIGIGGDLNIPTGSLNVLMDRRLHDDVV
jgi:hypothetical protein